MYQDIMTSEILSATLKLVFLPVKLYIIMLVNHYND